ncbi:hypothetical protein DFH09DRAFT_1093963 [Mycena vulgaris]|nr:hypothetical protein DFH09DRAFT_1093963 [Mycena vulgaris]
MEQNVGTTAPPRWEWCRRPDLQTGPLTLSNRNYQTTACGNHSFPTSSVPRDKHHCCIPFQSRANSASGAPSWFLLDFRWYPEKSTPRGQALLPTGVLGATTIATRAADAIVVNFLKPAVGLAELICDTAETVRGDCGAALELNRQQGGSESGGPSGAAV